MEVAVAGVPKYIGAGRDYDAIFEQLSAAGIRIFFPVFQYQEAPEPKSLGFEADFVPPCRRDGPGFRALRAHGIRLIVPAGLLYAPGEAMPPLDEDPLRRLLACAGRAAVYGVLSFDEPVLNGLSVDATGQLYERVKAVDPSLPVLMVHAPLVIEPGRQDSDAAREDYLEQVRAQSRNADIVGFSLYPIPSLIAKMGAPGAGDAVVEHAQAVEDYMRWLAEALPDRRRMAVLQSFAYRDQFSPEYLPEVAPPELIEAARAPSRAELSEMAQIAVDDGVDLVVWYGSGFTWDAGSNLWKNVLAVSTALEDAQ